MEMTLDRRRGACHVRAGRSYFLALRKRRIMTLATRLTAGLVCVLLVSGCPGVPYNPATNTDTTPPAIGIRITGDSPSSVWNTTTNTFSSKVAMQPVDVGARVPGTPVTPVPVKVHEHGEAVLLATAQDNESGVRSIKLTCQRRTYYNWNASSQTEANAVLAPVTTQQDYQLNNGVAPKSGIQQRVLNMWGQMLFPSSQGTAIRAHRVSNTCTAEATNFNGSSAQTQAVLVWAQDHAVQP